MSARVLPEEGAQLLCWGVATSGSRGDRRRGDVHLEIGLTVKPALPPGSVSPCHILYPDCCPCARAISVPVHAPRGQYKAQGLPAWPTGTLLSAHFPGPASRLRPLRPPPGHLCLRSLLTDFHGIPHGQGVAGRSAVSNRTSVWY